MSSTFVVYVEDKPGVLNRVASLFRRRAFNIESLTVGHTDTPGVSRMTIVVDTDRDGARKVEAHLYKLVNVLRVDDVTSTPAVYRDLAMIKVHGHAGDALAHHAAGRRLPRAHRRRRAGFARWSRSPAPRTRSTACSTCCGRTACSKMVRTGRVAMARGAARTPRVRPASAALRGPMPRIPREPAASGPVQLTA